MAAEADAEEEIREEQEAQREVAEAQERAIRASEQAVDEAIFGEVDGAV